MRFRPPQTLEDAIQLITTLSIFLDFWISRSQDWIFTQLLTKVLDTKIWAVIAQCVVTEADVSLEDVPFTALGTAGILEALTVFSTGLMQLEIPQIYLTHCAGLSTAATMDLIKHAQQLRQEVQAITDPQMLLAHLFSQTLAASLS